MYVQNTKMWWCASSSSSSALVTSQSQNRLQLSTMRHLFRFNAYIVLWLFDCRYPFQIAQFVLLQAHLYFGSPMLKLKQLANALSVIVLESNRVLSLTTSVAVSLPAPCVEDTTLQTVPQQLISNSLFFLLTRPNPRRPPLSPPPPLPQRLLPHRSSFCPLRCMHFARFRALACVCVCLRNIMFIYCLWVF